MFNTIDEIQQRLTENGYIVDRGLATAIFIALTLPKPLFLEGEAGVGKTEVAKVLARILATRLIRLQCYEGLDVNTAVYEWNYQRQILEIRLLEAEGVARDAARKNIFSEEFLLKRPLLQAIENHSDRAPVLLIDELDRADEEFESFLLELLSDWQITIPELGTLRAQQPPIVVITSNRTREIHDALKRRCIYHWIDLPAFEKELQIVRAKVPGISEALAQQIVTFVQELRRQDLYKLPGIAETLDWAQTLLALKANALDETTIKNTLGVLLKYQDDVQKISDQYSREASSVQSSEH
ncbi:MAG: MoxR family ATPase [Chloroflexi bacterium]|nr:MoxR family ATPase [Chloroflexota bacterium]